MPGVQAGRFDAPDETWSAAKTKIEVVKWATRPPHAYVIEPGHDAWVVGDELVVVYEFEARPAEEYARVHK